VRHNKIKVISVAVDFIQDESGQSTVEYLLILSVCVLGVGSMVRQIRNIFDTATLRIGAVLEQDLKSGRAPLSVWSN